ncbi:hypothetical protein R3P38DRAFT_2792886 [Favolaschia claudopus]|uniref:Uncharacterized protein n=1 Tax=Favolaschia claudopus TaxID=2862362 RepID=A0AAW0AEK4_9AGAR
MAGKSKPSANAGKQPLTGSAAEFAAQGCTNGGNAKSNKSAKSAYGRSGSGLLGLPASDVGADRAAEKAQGILLGCAGTLPHVGHSGTAIHPFLNIPILGETGRGIGGDWLRNIIRPLKYAADLPSQQPHRMSNRNELSSTLTFKLKVTVGVGWELGPIGVRSSNGMSDTFNSTRFKLDIQLNSRTAVVEVFHSATQFNSNRRDFSLSSTQVLKTKLISFNLTRYYKPIRRNDAYVEVLIETSPRPIRLFTQCEFLNERRAERRRDDVGVDGVDGRRGQRRGCRGGAAAAMSAQEGRGGGLAPKGLKGGRARSGRGGTGERWSGGTRRRGGEEEGEMRRRLKNLVSADIKQDDDYARSSAFTSEAEALVNDSKIINTYLRPYTRYTEAASRGVRVVVAGRAGGVSAERRVGRGKRKLRNGLSGKGLTSTSSGAKCSRGLGPHSKHNDTDRTVSTISSLHDPEHVPYLIRLQE